MHTNTSIIASTQAVIRDLIFPATCVGCGIIGKTICKRCLGQLKPSREECGWCREKSSGFRTHKGCIEDFPIDKCIICWEYDLLGREIMSQFKYKFRYTIVEKVVETAVPLVARYAGNNNFLVPIPTSPKRIKDRGFNQSHLIAKQLGSHLNIPISNLLKMGDKGSHQTGKDRSARLERSVDVRLNSKDTIPRQIILVDDVCTTGTTLLSCATFIKNTQPDTKISAFALFRGKSLASGVN